MRSKEKIKLTTFEWFRYHSFSFALTAASLVFVYPFIEYYLFNIPNRIAKDFSALLYMVPLLSGSIFYYWLNWRRLFFNVYKEKMSDGQFKRAVRVTAKELDWQYAILENNEVHAIRNSSHLGIEFQRIVIKKKEDKIFITSIRNPEYFRNGSTEKKHKENISTFVRNAAQIVKGENVEQNLHEKQRKKEDDFWKKSEWTIKDILMRIVGYGLASFFLIIGCLIICFESWAGLFFIIIFIGICATYIRYDIQILSEKRRRKKIKQQQ